MADQAATLQEGAISMVPLMVASDGNDVVRVFSPNFGDSYDSPIQELRDGDFIDMNFNSLNVRLVVGKTTEKNTATAGHYL